MTRINEDRNTDDQAEGNPGLLMMHTISSTPGQ